MKDMRKIATFAISGAIGCFVAAIVGEIWLRVTRIDVQSPANMICLLLDCSGSMDGEKLQEMKRSAVDFVRGRDLTRDKVAVVGFGSSVNVASGLTDDVSAIVSAIDGLGDGGSTNMASGLQTAAGTLGGGHDSNSILLFTDGMPDSAPDAIQAADRCLTNKMQLVAVATGDANTQLLTQVTRDQKLVFFAAAGQYASAFKQASAAIGRQQLIESRASGGGLAWEVVRLAVWTALVAAGLAVALVAGQNYYFRRGFWRKKEGVPAILGGLAVGALAGILVQSLFGATSSLPAIVVLAGRWAGWTALGAMIGVALTWFVPNLRLQRGLVGGSAGGFVGGMLFIILALFADTTGRFLGAVVVGLAIGAMIAFAEVSARKAWLEIVYGPKERRTITLGHQAVAVGNDKERCQILISGAPGVAYRYSTSEGRVLLEDVSAGRTFDVYDGDTRHLGKVSLVVRLSVESVSRGDRQELPASHQPLARTERESREPATEDRSRPPTRKAAADQVAPKAAPVAGPVTGFFLSAGGRLMPLADGARFTAHELGLRGAGSPTATCAEVVQNPAQPGVFGLKNLTTHRWSAVLANGEVREIEPGKSIRLAKGTRVTIDKATVEID